MNSSSPAEALLQKYGITDPQEIDLEVLAFAAGARVKYRQMKACEARITGIGDKAVITIDDRYGARRARFSLAHEMGHWHHHRNQRLYCSKDDIGKVNGIASGKERQADRYAADLMMPRYLFEPLQRAFATPSFASVDALAKEFSSSRKAAALRYIDLDSDISMLVCYGPEGRKWYHSSSSWPETWIPKKEHDPDTDVLDLLFGKKKERKNRTIEPASAFFARYDAERYEVYAHSVVSGSSSTRSSREVLTLLIPRNAEMLEDDGW